MEKIGALASPHAFALLPWWPQGCVFFLYIRKLLPVDVTCFFQVGRRLLRLLEQVEIAGHTLPCITVSVDDVTRNQSLG